jgi:ribosomal protein S18 acetylase RimI-like enzyme
MSDDSRSAKSAIVTLVPVLPADRQAFLQMAAQHFCELNPNFVATEDWNRYYFDRILENPKLCLRWIMTDHTRGGFILFGVEDHIFLPQRNGVVYELYVLPAFRRRGIAGASAELAIDQLQQCKPSKIHLDIMQDNRSAAEFWATLGFARVAERWVLRRTKT